MPVTVDNVDTGSKEDAASSAISYTSSSGSSSYMNESEELKRKKTLEDFVVRLTSEESTRRKLRVTDKSIIREDDTIRRSLSVADRAIYDLSSPLPLTNLFVHRPCLVILVIYMCLIAITSFVLYMNWFEPTVQTPRDYLIWTDQKTIDFDKFNAAKLKLIEGDISGDNVIPL